MAPVPGTGEAKQSVCDTASWGIMFIPSPLEGPSPPPLTWKKGQGSIGGEKCCRKGRPTSDSPTPTQMGARGGLASGQPLFLSPDSARPSSELARYFGYDASEGCGGVGHPPDLNLGQKTPPAPCSLSLSIRVHTGCTACTAPRVHPALASRGPGFSIFLPSSSMQGVQPDFPASLAMGNYPGLTLW